MKSRILRLRSASCFVTGASFPCPERTERPFDCQAVWVVGFRGAACPRPAHPRPRVPPAGFGRSAESLSGLLKFGAVICDLADAGRTLNGGTRGRGCAGRG